MDGYRELIECGHGPIVDAAMKCEAVFSTHERALVSISGGADSDVMLDLCERVRQEVGIQVDYVWFDTGMEYRATREHLQYLEQRYGIDIMRQRSVKTIPVCAREHGQPFVSKMVSHHLEILQYHGFGWDDKTVGTLHMMYPRIPLSTIRWWCDDYATMHNAYNAYCISRNKYLKQFVMQNPPWFRISADCCKYAKKRTKHELLADGDWDVELVGIRQTEGGVRSLHGRCFIEGGGLRDRVDEYYPLYWLRNGHLPHG